MITALPRVVAQLGDPRFVGVFIKSIVLTLAILVGAWFALDAFLGSLDVSAWPALLQRPWAATGDHAALPFIIIGGYFLFPGIATAVMSLFLDEVVDAVEARHYPLAKASRRVSAPEAAMLGFASGARVLLWNLALAPLYLVLVFTAIGPLVLFVVVNGWLMGRDLLEMVAIRHMPRAEAKAFVAANRAARVQLGAATAPIFLVPFVNLLAPILSAALAAHAFHAARKF